MLGKVVRRGRQKATRAAVNAYHRASRRSGDDLLDEDWDVLVLLDACRPEYYRAQTPFDGVPETRYSVASSSVGFVRRTFHGRRLHSTVYVSANPHVYLLEDDMFHAVEDCYDAWDPDLQTVRPADVTALGREAAAEYPRKRLICHYMQPHTPYLGPTAARIREEHGLAGWRPDHTSDGTPVDRDRPLIWDLAADGTVGWDAVRTAYAETLEAALDAVVDLVDAVDGRVAVSADHAELLGERLVPGGPREWAHTHGLAAPRLRRVPWHVVQTGPRREVVADPPEDRDRLDDDEVADRLAALGYAPEAESRGSKS